MKDQQKEKGFARARRKARVRAKVSGTSARPRLNIFRSLCFINAQIIDDTKSCTLVSIHSKNVQTKGTKTAQAHELGKELAQRAKSKGIQQVVFDRGGYAYHGRVKAFADGAREGGLEF